ncbi:MAG: hypothetical protein V4792_11875 [Pseudomonadota bacterium]
MVKRIIPLLMMGYTLWRWNQRRSQAVSRRTDGVEKPAAMSRWEGEGGALREGGRSSVS